MERKPFNPESLYELCWVSDPQIAPDGERVAYVQHWVEEGTKDGKRTLVYRTALYLSDGPEMRSRRLTRSVDADDWMPRWSPDGRSIAFLSTRDAGKPHLFVLDLNGGEATQLTRPAEFSEGVRSFDWHPGGVSFCFVSRGHKSDEERKADEERDERVYDGRLPYKFDGVGLFEPRRLQLWRIERDGSEMRQMTEWPADVSQPRWSPRGNEVVFVSFARPEHERQYTQDLFVVPANGGTPRQVTRSEGPISSPVWFPSADRLLYLGHKQRRGNATNVGIWLVDVETGDDTCLTDQFDRSVGCSIVSDSHAGLHSDCPVLDGEQVLFLATDQGRCGIYRVGLDGGSVEQINTSGMSVIGFGAARGNLVFSGETNARMAEVYTMTNEGRHVERRSHAADHVFGQYRVSLPEHLRFEGADGWEIEGWVLKPLDFEPGRRYPLVLYVHGGPHWDYGNSFFHEFQVLAAQGYGVLYCNPRGSRSYGEQFTAAVRQHFGEKDWEDQMRAADLAETWDWVDPKRMGIVGGSYGGYIVNWTITHTDRFVAACTQRSISNLVSFMGTSDIGPEFGLDEFGTMPWENEALLMEKSPIRYVEQVRTPTLILHQEGDQRCPIEQGEQLYTALAYLGVPVRFVRFPGESHGMSRAGMPRRRVARMHHIIDWFNQYTRAAAEG